MSLSLEKWLACTVDNGLFVVVATYREGLGDEGGKSQGSEG